MSGKDNPPSVRYSRVMEPDDKGVAELTSKIVGQPRLSLRLSLC
jgi:hypothetical protein